MTFADFATAVNTALTANTRDCVHTQRHDDAEWSWVDRYYTFALRNVDNSIAEATFTIDNGGDSFGLLPMTSDGASTALEFGEAIFRASETHHFTGRYEPDPGIKDMGSAWSYTDSNGRHVHAGRYNGTSMRVLDETAVIDPDIGIAEAFNKYVANPAATIKHRREVDDIGKLLATTGESLTQIYVADKPDIRFERFCDPSNLAYVEHSRAVVRRSAELDAALTPLTDALRVLTAEAAVANALDGIELRVGIRYDVSSDRFPNPKTVVSEVRQLITSANFDQLTFDSRIPFGAEFPHLHRFKLGFIKKANDGVGTVSLRRTDTYDDARILESVVRSRLTEKTILAKTYGVGPLWLGLYVQDSAGHTDFTLNAIDHKALDFAPFETLIIGDEDGLIKYSV